MKRTRTGPAGSGGTEGSGTVTSRCHTWSSVSQQNHSLNVRLAHCRDLDHQVSRLPIRFRAHGVAFVVHTLNSCLDDADDHGVLREVLLDVVGGLGLPPVRLLVRDLGLGVAGGHVVQAPVGLVARDGAHPEPEARFAHDAGLHLHDLALVVGVLLFHHLVPLHHGGAEEPHDEPVLVVALVRDRRGEGQRGLGGVAPRGGEESLLPLRLLSRIVLLAQVLLDQSLTIFGHSSPPAGVVWSCSFGSLRWCSSWARRACASRARSLASSGERYVSRLSIVAFTKWATGSSIPCRVAYWVRAR